MNNIENLVQEYNDLNQEIINKYGSIFSKENKNLFKSRIMEISKEMVKGREKPNSFHSSHCEKYSIPFGLIQVEEMGLDPFTHYFGRFIEWSVVDDNIVASIETVTRGERDSIFDFTIPVSDQKYYEYLSKLKEEGEERIKSNELKKSIEEKKKEEEEEEIKLLEELKLKYERVS